MKRQIKKNLSFLLSFVMVISMFAHPDVVVAATGEKVSITPENYRDYYVQDDNGEYCYSVSSGDAYGSIYVPGEHYHLIVESAVTADQVILESGANLEIIGNGALSFSDSGSGIQASDGALMMLESKANKPEAITGLFDFFHDDETDQDVEIDIYEDPGDPEWQWMRFCYTASESGEGKWYVCPGDGPEPGTLCVHYDNRDGGSVTWGATQMESDIPVSFIDTENSTEEQLFFKEINLTFHTPEDIEKAQIQVLVNGANFYDNGETCTINDEYLQELFGDSTASYFGTDESGYVTFTYNPSRDDAVDIEVIWLRPGGPQFNDNEYSVMYDPNGDASVTVNGELIGDRETKTFSVDEVLNFTLTPPDFRQDQTPIVEIVVHDGDASTGKPETVWRSDFEEGNPNKITLSNNTFSFTPTSEKGFEVFINWSEYDAFGGNDAYPVVVQVDCQGTIGFDGVSDENKINLNNFTKVRVAEDTASLTLTWEEGSAPSQIKVEVNEQTQKEEERWLILDEDDFSNNSCSIPLTSLDENGNKKHFYYVCVEYSGNQGGGNNQYNFTRLQDELNETYFAFGDINNDGSADTDDLKYGVMRNLYDDFRVNEGRYQREGAALGLIEDFNKQDPTNLNLNMNWLLSSDENRNVDVQISQIQDEFITAKDKSGDSHSFDAYQITITINAFYENRADLTNFPAESEKVTLDAPIVLTAKAYLINMTNSDEQVIIKVKDNYFVRDAFSEAGNDYDLERFEGLNAWALILVADYDKEEDIVLFGNYASATETFSDETSDRFFASGFGSGEILDKYLGDKFVVMKPGFLGVTINGSGETKEPLAWSVTSSLSIAETGVNSGNNTETDIYFGFDSVEIVPITSEKVAGLSVTSISAVEVLDGIPENAVKVEETAPGSKYSVHFLSDYYDTVRIKVTYNTTSGSQSGIMTLNRVGIMIQGGMTAGDSHIVNIFHGHDMGETLDNNVYNAYIAANPDKTHGIYKYAYYATYYYPTDSNATSADTSLFVTYTYADGSVERKLIQSDYFTAATEENVAMSDYILYMGDGSNAPVKVEAIVIPNVNADGTINGAKLGAGKGVEGTFDIEFE